MAISKLLDDLVDNTGSEAAVRLRDDEHGDVAIAYPIGQCAQKADDFAVFNCDQSDLRP